jgi:hypothetical protein
MTLSGKRALIEMIVKADSRKIMPHNSLIPRGSSCLTTNRNHRSRIRTAKSHRKSSLPPSILNPMNGQDLVFAAIESEDDHAFLRFAGFS